MSAETDVAAACNGAAPTCAYRGVDTPRFIGCYQDSEGTGGSAIRLGGNTVGDDEYGLTFDGEEDWAIITAEGAGGCSRRRDCHLMAPPCTFVRCFNGDRQGVSVK